MRDAVRIERMWSMIETKIYAPTPEHIAYAGKLLAEGDVVGIPTETVYGLAADAWNNEAVRRIFAVKGRPQDNPLIVHISAIEQMEPLVKEIPLLARTLAEKFWPGPLTIILEKNAHFNSVATAGMDTVGIRMPSHPVARRFLQDSGCMIAAPSANTSGRPSPTTAQHVWEDLQGKIEVLLDGGPVGIGIESTIVDLSEDQPMILRPGFITQEMLSQVLGQVGMDPGIASENSKKPPKAPGMRYRHYAPKADLTLVEGHMDQVIAKINALTGEAQVKGQSVGVLATAENQDAYIADHVIVIGQREDEAEIARHLFDVLRQFDTLGVDVIYSESFAAAGVGQAIMNRLLKAAGHKRIFV